MTMLHNSPKALLIAFLIVLLSGCLNEDTQPQPEQGVKGRIVLNIADMEAYTDAGITRAVQTLPSSEYSKYTYTLTGRSLIDNQPVSKTGVLTELMGNANMEVEAGTYTLTVRGGATLKTASETGYGDAYYEGTSVDVNGDQATFDIHVGSTTNVNVLLKPANAKLTIDYEDDGDRIDKDTFADFYGNGTFTASGRAINLTSPSTVVYFPAGTVNYTIAVEALAGSHVTDITSATGTIDLTAGCYHTLTLRANPVTGELIPVVSGTHTEKFD